MQASLAFYTNGIGFEMTNKWIPDRKIRWCWLQFGGAALMLQEFGEKQQLTKEEKQNLGKGVSIYFICEDALTIYKETLSRGLSPEEPFVGNNMWVVKFVDPDGYNIFFVSDTDVAEETMYSDWMKTKLPQKH